MGNKETRDSTCMRKGFFSVSDCLCPPWEKGAARTWVLFYAGRKEKGGRGSRRRRTRVIFPLSLSFPFSFLLPTLRRRIAFHKSGGRGRREGSSELRPTLARWPYVPSPSNPTRQGLVGRGLRKRTVEDRTFLPPPHSPFRIRNNSLDCRFAHAIPRLLLL